MALSDAPKGLDVDLRIGANGPAVLEGLSSFGEVCDVAPLHEVGPGEHAATNGGGASNVVRLRLRLARENALPELAPWLVARGIALYELRVRRKSLEESFIEIMGEDQTPG